MADKDPTNYLKDSKVGQFYFARNEWITKEKNKKRPDGGIEKVESKHLRFMLVLDKGSVKPEDFASTYDPSGETTIWGTTIPNINEAPKGQRDFVPWRDYQPAYAMARRAGKTDKGLPAGTVFCMVGLGESFTGEARNYLKMMGGPEVKAKADQIAAANDEIDDLIMSQIARDGGNEIDDDPDDAIMNDGPSEEEKEIEAKEIANTTRRKPPKT